MNYFDLTLNQRIEIKGLIQSEGRTMPEIYSKKGADNTDLVLLKCMWVLQPDPRLIVDIFLDKYVNNGENYNYIP
jgi:hypothetical protein